MRIWKTTLALVCLTVATAGWAGTPGGSGELSLDGAALAAWADRSLPNSWSLPAAGAGGLELRRGVPERPELTDEGIRWILPITLEPGAIEAKIAVDLTPHWDRAEGRLEFVVTRLELVRGELPIGIPASWLPEFPSWKLPRTIDWSFPGEDEEHPVVAWLQGYSLSRDRLTLEFGLGYP